MDHRGYDMQIAERDDRLEALRAEVARLQADKAAVVESGLALLAERDALRAEKTALAEERNQTLDKLIAECGKSERLRARVAELQAELQEARK